MGHFEWMNWRLSPILFASSSTSLLHLLPLPAHGMSAAFLNPLATDKASITLLEACQREPPIAIADCQQGPLSKQQTPFLQVAQRGAAPRSSADSRASRTHSRTATVATATRGAARL